MLYEKIQKLCEERKISISVLEKKAGIGNGVIARWKKSTPNLNSIKAVAAALEIGVNQLID